MNKVFNVEIDGQITLPDGRKLGPLEETTVNVVQPSGGGMMVVTVTGNENGEYTADKTLKEIYDSTPNTICHLIVYDNNVEYFLPLYSRVHYDDYYGVVFTSIEPYTNDDGDVTGMSTNYVNINDRVEVYFGYKEF